MTALVVVLFLAQALTAVGLARTLHRSTLRWSLAPAIAASLGADLTMAFVTDDSFRPLGGALGLGLVAVLLGQVVRVERAEVIEALVAGCGCLLATAPAALVIGLDGLPQGGRPVLAIAAAAIIGALPLSLRAGLGPLVARPGPLGTRLGPLVARLAPVPARFGPLGDLGRIIAGTVVAALICSHSSRVEPFDGVLLGLAATAGAVVGRKGLTPPYAKVAILAPVLMGITAGAIIGRGILG